MSNTDNIAGKTIKAMISVFKDNEIKKIAKEWCNENNITEFKGNDKQRLIEYLADYIMNKTL